MHECDGFVAHDFMVTKPAIMIRNEVNQELLKEAIDKDEEDDE